MTEISKDSILWTPVGHLHYVKFFPPEKSKKPNPETGEYDYTWAASIVFDDPNDEDNEVDAKTKKRFADIRKVEKTIIQEKWNGKKPGGYKAPYRFGNDYDEDAENYETYKGKVIINVRSKNIEVVPKRKVGEKNGKAILETCTKKNFYSGCHGCATIKLFGYDVETEGGRSRGVSASLQNIYLSKLGDPLGFRRRTAEEDFEEADDDDFETFDSDDEMMSEDDDDDDDYVPRKSKKGDKGKKKSRSYDDDDEF